MIIDRNDPEALRRAAAALVEAHRADDLAPGQHPDPVNLDSDTD